MMKTKITIFTPTYNRADLLRRCYESMKRQTNQNFIWLIIDDGSTDNTKDVIQEWELEEKQFCLQYIYKQNGGLHTAYNTAIANIETELCACIDSDDYMPDDAIEKILSFWELYGSSDYAGIVGLDYYLDGKVIGDELPNQKAINLIDLLIGKYRIINGDRTNVVRTELYKKYAPMIVFLGEKNFNPHYLHLQISKNYDFLVLNENLRYVEYQPTGMSNSMLKQYRNSPNSFIEIRKLYLSFDNAPIKFKLKHSIHLVSSCIIAGDISRAWKESPEKIYSFLMLPAGWILSLIIKWKTK